MANILVQITALTESESSKGNYVLVLENEEKNQKIPLIIGETEAKSIAMHLENLRPNRPLAHDLFVDILLKLDVKILYIWLYKFEQNIFHTNSTLSYL